MNDPSSKDTLELEVTNFGPIAKANIELRPLTVFVGPSNTGKSYLAILIYALHKFFSGGQQISDWNWFTSDIQPNWRNKVSRENLNDLAEWADKILAQDETTLTDEESLMLPEPFADLIRSAFAGFNYLGNHIGHEINRCFGISETEALIREKSRGGSLIVLRNHIPDDPRPFVHKFRIGVSDTTLSTTIPEKIPMRLYLQNPRSSSTRIGMTLLKTFVLLDKISTGLPKTVATLKDDKSLEYIVKDLAGLAIRHVVGSLHSPAFYLPADRTGVMHAHNVVVKALIESATMVGLSPSASTPALSGVLGDFLKHLIEISTPPPESSPSSQQRQPQNRRFNPGNQIEENILSGLVRANKSESGYPLFTYRPQGWKRKSDLPLMNASSMVSELAPVVLYLRHIVQSDNVLIVEEPESHLHPAMQVEFTRQLAAIVHSGIRVIVTTHSEWLLDELANLVQLSGLPKARRSGIQGADFALHPQQVGAWLFEPKLRPKGSVVKEIPLDESGLFPSGFSDVAFALHNNWAEISSRAGKNQ